MIATETKTCEDCDEHIATHMVTEGSDKPRALCRDCRMLTLTTSKEGVSEERIVYRGR